jgi:hypothetical protein
VRSSFYNNTEAAVPEKLITPTFLGAGVAKQAVEMALLAAGLAPGIFAGDDGDNHHIVVLVPAMKDDRPNYMSWPDYPIHPKLLYEVSKGDTSKWKYKFDEIARCKALQLWHDRNDGRTDCMPHLLFSGDTPYWGGVKRNGLVVACSGYEPHYDKMISGMVIDVIVAIAYQYWMCSDDKKADVSFVS